MNDPVKKLFRKKYKYLSCEEIERLHITNKDSSFVEWYEALKAYSRNYGHDFDKTSITSCGKECWRKAFDCGDDVSDAFTEGFSD